MWGKRQGMGPAPGFLYIVFTLTDFDAGWERSLSELGIPKVAKLLISLNF
jgi:hypothetical protein